MMIISKSDHGINCRTYLLTWYTMLLVMGGVKIMKQADIYFSPLEWRGREMTVHHTGMYAGLGA